MPPIGIRNFLLVVRINSLINFDDNHYDILNPLDETITGKSSRVLGTLSLPNKEGISDYRFYTLDELQVLILAGPLYIPNPNEIIILINKSIKSPITSRMNEFILRYLGQDNIERFLDNVTQVIKTELDPLDNI